MRSSRLQPVHAAVESTERRIARQLAQAERQLSDGQAKLTELERYHAEYSSGFQQRAATGIDAVGLRDYQVFLARLNEAVKQQRLIVQRAETDREAARKQWQQAARRVRALAHVMDQWLAQERRALDRREQNETDERAQRTARMSLGS